MEDLYLGIDVGTSATKVVLVRPGGRVVGRSTASHRDARSVGRGRVDPGPWVRSLAEACAGLGPAAADVTAVGTAVHAPVALFLDPAGSPLAPGMTWEDPRLARCCAAAAALRSSTEARLVGNRVVPATAMALAWAVLAEEEPGLAARCATFGMVGTWLGLLLTGRAALDPTQASYMGVMAGSDGSHRWLDDLAPRYGVPTSVLPEVLPPASLLGGLTPAASALLGVPAGVPVAVGSADTAAAAYLLGLRQGGAPLYTVGTTHVITTCSEAPDPEPVALSRSHVVTGRWLSHGATNGGDALAMGAALLGFGSGGDAVHAMTVAAGRARAADVEDAPVFIPHVTAERGPLWLDGPRTALVGMLPGTGANVAAWGVVEGTAFADRLVLEICTADRLASDAPVVITGNFGSAAVYPQIVADVLARPVDLVDESHLPAMGAAAIAAATTGGTPFPVPAARRIEPRPGWEPTIARRWHRFAQQWSITVGRPFPVAVAEPAAPVASLA